jgi:hypothetical protein
MYGGCLNAGSFRKGGVRIWQPYFTNLIENPSENKYICGIDINNLYGYSMIQKIAANKLLQLSTAEQFQKKKRI